MFEEGYDDIPGSVSFLWDLAILPGAYLLHGFVFVKLWTWFVVTTFGLSTIGLVPAIGLCIFVGFLTAKFPNWDARRSHFQQKIERTTWIFLYPLMILGVGYIVHLFM